MMQLSLTLNGEARTIEIEPDAMLLDVVRSLGLTGAKEGCGVGVCGLCMMVINELPVSACIYVAALAAGKDVWTVEGLTARDPALLEAFVVEEGMQCGICTPGQVVSTYTLKRECPNATEEQAREYMAGNLCRCTGYVSITSSVMKYLASEAR
ncbi:MAG: 2Fe-2S iron-sulfur cluster binding domain-containing protein [Actinobacteria bacterium]|nr:2Fe-2S iron-sulfur cluster binding domain-containing protein [Actinomycetota bacterium]